MTTTGADIFIGVDGGGTGCRAVVGTADRVLGDAQGGPANISSDARGAVRNVLEVIMKASAAAGLRDVASVRAHIGLAGVLTPEHADLVTRVMPFEKCVVTDDRPTTIAGALGGVDGFVAAIGTGSFMGAKLNGAFHYVGGWGLNLGDEASAAWLGKSALATTLLAVDGMAKETALTKAILARHGDDPNAIVAFAATASPAEYGSFAQVVTETAQLGDEHATRLMQDGAFYITNGWAVMKPTLEHPFCLTGGLGPSYAPYMDAEFQKCLVPAKGSALDGALSLARAID